MIRLMWLPVFLWMALIIWFSTGHFSDANTSKVLRSLLLWLVPWANATHVYFAHFIVRKAAHIGEYAVLASLWYSALRRARLWPEPRSAWTALFVAVAWSFVDELHQTLHASRTPSLLDIGFDTAGAMIGSFIARRDSRHAITAMAAAAPLVIALNIAVQFGSQTLLISLPIFGALFALISRRRRLTSGRTQDAVQAKGSR